MRWLLCWLGFHKAPEPRTAQIGGIVYGFLRCPACRRRVSAIQAVGFK